MSAAVPLRDDFDAPTLRRLSRSCSDNRQIRRLLALAAVYDGMNRTEAARIGGMDRQTLRDWVHRFNESGPEGLINLKGAGRPRLLSDEQMKELARVVETGPGDRWCRTVATSRSGPGDRGAFCGELLQQRDRQISC